MNGVAFRDAIIFVKKLKIIAIVFRRLLEESGKSCKFVGMKLTLPDIIRKNDNLRQLLLTQEGGIMKFWAEHPDRDFDTNLFDDYEKQLVKAYLKANKRNRTIVSLRGDELKLEARNWFRLTEKEIHYKVVLQPILATLPKEISEQVNQHIDDYLADAYRDYRRCFFSNGITPLAFYDEVVKQFGTQWLREDKSTDDPTGISEITASKPAAISNEWYTLEGLRLDKAPTAKGIYIQNGRKVVIK